MLARLGLGLGLFVGSLAVGFGLGRRRILTDHRASQLVQALVMTTSPAVLCLSCWRMDLRHVEPWLLPFVGTCIAGSTLIPAFLYARRARLADPQTGIFLASAYFSNVGYLGAFTAFALFGEAAYGLCVLFFVFFTPAFYTLGFWLGARYGGPRHGTSAPILKDELRLYPFIGMLAGLALNLVGIRRPAGLEWLNHVLIPVDTALYLAAIGSQLRFESLRPWIRPCLAMSAIKFLYAPLVAWLLVTALHLQGLPRMVVLLEASTPVAVSPLVLPLLFGLDRKLANALWVFTTLVAIPWFLILIPLLPRL